MIQKIYLAAPRGFCAGVDRAIDVVEAAIEIFGSPVYIKHAIVHNTHVVADLEKKGAIFIEEIDKVPPQSVLVFSAHGTPPKVKAEAIKCGHKVIDATCPLVTKVHLEAERYVRDGYFIIYIGHRGHPEPVGVFGEVPKDSIVLIENASEVKRLKIPQKNKLICLTQTTLSVGDTRDTIDKLKKKFKNITFPPSADICYATTNRQTAVRALAKKCDFVLVIGSKASSNSNRLVDVVKDEGAKAYLIDDRSDISEGLLKNAKILGLTSGASVPEYLVDQVIASICENNPGVKVENLKILSEEIKFPLPDDLVTYAKASEKGMLWVEKHRVSSQK